MLRQGCLYSGLDFSSRRNLGQSTENRPHVQLILCTQYIYDDWKKEWANESMPLEGGVTRQRLIQAFHAFTHSLFIYWRNTMCQKSVIVITDRIINTMNSLPQRSLQSTKVRRMKLGNSNQRIKCRKARVLKQTLYWRNVLSSYVVGSSDRRV